ncbi:MAG: hypothetical protein HY815_29950 [Candidatus Riflebacteria bacterium]|nr:hypothetical protein [Candidatus Riflebacteria bacterium]
MSSRIVLALFVAMVVLGSATLAPAGDECTFTKAMINSVNLHKQARDLYVAHGDFKPVLKEIEGPQKAVIEICVKELKEKNEHHPGNFVKLCAKAAGLPTSGAKCDDSFIKDGWDILAFWHGLKLFKAELVELVKTAQTPEEKALYEKYLTQVTDLRGKARERHHQFFSGGGCDGSCEN